MRGNPAPKPNAALNASLSSHLRPHGRGQNDVRDDKGINNFMDYPSRWSWREHLTRSSALIVNRLTCDAHKKLGATSGAAA
jgi:hypothetical protein